MLQLVGHSSYDKVGNELIGFGTARPIDLRSETLFGLRASVTSTEASNGRPARVGRIDRSSFGSIDFGIVGPTHKFRKRLMAPVTERIADTRSGLAVACSPRSRYNARHRRLL